MSKVTNEEIRKIQDKLDYIGLDLNNVPEFVKNSEHLEFRASKAIDERAYKVYKYVPISKIQILLTPNNRLDSLAERYANSDYISSYILPKNEDDIIKHTTFLNMLKEVEIQEIEALQKEQEILQSQIPFKVKYDGNYLWQIYFDEYTSNYFMLVPTRRKRVCRFI